MNRLLRSVLPVVLFVLVAAACVPSGEPVSWEDQADVTGEGLVEREFVAACLEANYDLGSVKAKRFCGCVLDGIQAKVPFEKFQELDAFIDDQRDIVTRDLLVEYYRSLVEISDDSAA